MATPDPAPVSTPDPAPVSTPDPAPEVPGPFMTAEEEARFNNLRHMIQTRMVSCPDCQKLKGDLVALMGFMLPAPDEVKPVAHTVVHASPNAEVRIINAPSPSPSGAAQGREIAPGVVVLDKPGK